MEIKRDMKSIAEDVSATIGSVKTLLSAIDDKVRFYLLDKNRILSDPLWELTRYHALEIQSLLGIAEVYLNEAEQDQDKVVGLLHGTRKEVEA